MKNTTEKIIDEITIALQSLGVHSRLLAIVCSWGDTLSDEDVLKEIKTWNQLFPSGIDVGNGIFTDDYEACKYLDSVGLTEDYVGNPSMVANHILALNNRVRELEEMLKAVKDLSQ